MFLEQYETEQDPGVIIDAFLDDLGSLAHVVEVKPGVRVAYYVKNRSEVSHKTEGELLLDLAEDGLKYRRLFEAEQ